MENEWCDILAPETLEKYVAPETLEKYVAQTSPTHRAVRKKYNILPGKPGGAKKQFSLPARFVPASPGRQSRSQLGAAYHVSGAAEGSQRTSKAVRHATHWYAHVEPNQPDARRSGYQTSRRTSHQRRCAQHQDGRSSPLSMTATPVSLARKEFNTIIL